LSSLDKIIERLQEHEVFQEIPLTDFSAHQPLLNHHLVHAALISVNGHVPYFRWNNDAASEFYGYKPDVTKLNLSFYYRIMKLRQVPLMVQGQQFFTKNKPGAFRFCASLKNSSGQYVDMRCLMKAAAFDSKGRAAYTVAVGAPQADCLWYEAYDVLKLSSCGSNPLKAGRLLFQGLSNQEIADKMDLSIKSVEKYLHEIYAHVGVKSRSELFAQIEG